MERHVSHAVNQTSPAGSRSIPASYFSALLNAKHEGSGSMSRLSSLDEYDSAVKAQRVADNTALRLHTLWREWQDKRDRLAAEADAAWEKVQADIRKHG
jgi:hypothetical protein